MDIIQAIKKRYSTKEFDPTKKISKEDFEKIKTLLRLSPSSTNIQPWHFVITSSESGKERITKGTEASFPFNTTKILEASHVVIFCSRIDADDDFMKLVLEKEDADGRFADAEFKEMMHKGRSTFVNIHRNDLKDLNYWMQKQVYLNLGSFLLGVSALGLDALPMEGLDMQVLNKEFGLNKQRYTAVCAVALGYHRESDFNATLPKSRLSENDIITIVD